jgi:hypothetical protein
VAWIDVVTEGATVEHARRDVRAGEIAPDGSWSELWLDFTLAEMTMGVELRVFSWGAIALEGRVEVRLERPADVAAAVVLAQPMPAEPRIRELASSLAQRTAQASSYHARRLVRRR